MAWKNTPGPQMGLTIKCFNSGSKLGRHMLYPRLPKLRLPARDLCFIGTDPGNMSLAADLVAHDVPHAVPKP